jgi:hypothetical protein
VTTQLYPKMWRLMTADNDKKLERFSGKKEEEINRE